MIKKNSLLYNTIVFGIGSLGTKAIQFLLIPIMTAFMRPNEFGKVDYYTSFVMLLVPIVSLSIADGIVRFGIQQTNQEKKILISNIFTILLFFSMLLLIISATLLFFGTELYAVLALFLMGQTANQVILSLLKVKELNIMYALSGFISALFQMGTLIVIFEKYSHSAETYFLTSSMTLILVNLLLLLIIRPSIHKMDYSLIVNILKYSIPLIPNVLLWWIMNFSDRFFIKYFLGFTSSGYYSLATKFPILINTVMLIFLQAWQLELFKITDKKKLNQLINAASSIFNYFNYLLLAILIPLIPFVLTLMANSNYNSAKEFVPLLLMSGIYSNLAMFIGTNYLVSKNTNRMWMTAVIGAVINLILNILAIPLIGINGASLATLISYVAVYIYRFFDQKQQFQLKVDIKRVFIINIVVFCQIYTFYFYKQLLGLVSIITICVILLVFMKSVYEFNEVKNNS